jgi:hypothetical protein
LGHVQGDTFIVVTSLGLPDEPGAHVARCSLELPRNVQVVSGEWHGVASLGGSNRWTAYVTVDEPVVIEGWATRKWADGVDRIVGRLAFDPRDRTNSSHWSSRNILQESVRRGRRYRYGDVYLVPLSKEEPPVTVARLMQRGSRRASVAEQNAIACASCPADQDSLAAVVMVGPRGRIHEVRLGSRTNPVQADIRAEVERGLRRWKFRPAQIDGFEVSDFVEVRVPLRQHRR